MNLCLLSLFWLYAWLTYAKLQGNVTYIMICLCFLWFICVLFVSFKIGTFKCPHTIFLTLQRNLDIYCCSHNWWSSHVFNYPFWTLLLQKFLFCINQEKLWSLCNDIYSDHMWTLSVQEKKFQNWHHNKSPVKLNYSAEYFRLTAQFFYRLRKGSKVK